MNPREYLFPVKANIGVSGRYAAAILASRPDLLKSTTARSQSVLLISMAALISAFFSLSL